MKFLCLDVGEKVVGVAVSDDAGSIAFPLEEVARADCVDRVLAFIDERDVGVVVLGQSVDLDGEDNPIMKDVRIIAGALDERVRVTFAAEQFSTQAAKRLGKGSDAEAAAIILQSFLDRRRGVKREEHIDFD